MLEVNKIHLGDSVEKMKEIDDKSIQHIFTSPPYNAIRKDWGKINRYDEYQDDKTFEEYVEWIVGIFNKLESKLKSEATILFNISYTTRNPSLPFLLISEN
jgi:DNA modification methylase